MEFTCAWERMHGVRIDQLSSEDQRRLVIDRARQKGVLDLRAAFADRAGVRRAA